MKLIRKRIEEARKEAGLSWEIIEKDYILSWVLAGIAANKKLQNKLVFKGGTALKKCYFRNYRFFAGYVLLYYRIVFFALYVLDK